MQRAPTPKRPVADITGECSDLLALCRAEAEALAQGGFDLSLLKTLPELISSIDSAEGAYSVSIARLARARKDLRLRLGEARKLRARVREALAGELLDRGISYPTGSISRKRGIADVQQHLSDLKAACEFHGQSTPLESVKPARLQEIGTTMAQLDALFAFAVEMDAKKAAAAQRRNQLCWEALTLMRKVRRRAKLALQTRDKARLFVDQYHSRKRKEVAKSTRKRPNTTENPNPSAEQQPVQAEQPQMQSEQSQVKLRQQSVQVEQCQVNSEQS